MLRLESVIKEHHPAIHAQLTSPQYPLAEKLLTYKIVYSLNEEEMADLAGVTLDEIIRMENVDISIPIDSYQAAINLFKKRIVEKNQSEECYRESDN